MKEFAGLTSVRRALVVVSALVAVLCAVPAGASAVELSCGDTITEDTTLTADVVCAEGAAVPFALQIAADNVTLNLNGYDVQSDLGGGSYVPISVVGRTGVTVAGGDRLTDRGGFTWFVRFENTTDSEVRGVQAAWINLAGSDRNRVAQTQGHISLYNDSDHNLIEGNNTGESESGGVAITRGSDHNVVRNNTLCGGMGGPLRIEDSSYNLIEQNFVPSCNGIGDTSIHIQGIGTGNRLVNNTVIGDTGNGIQDVTEYGPSDGIEVLSPGTFLSGNVANGFTGYGINAVEGVTSGLNYASGNGNPAQCRNVICIPPIGGQPNPPAGPSAPPVAPEPPGAGQTPAADLTPPAIALAAKKRQRLGKTIKVAVSAGEDLRASAHGKLKIASAGRTYRLSHTVGRRVTRGEQLTLKLTLPPAARAAARRALSHGKLVKAMVTVRAIDAAGNSSSATRTVLLSR